VVAAFSVVGGWRYSRSRSKRDDETTMLLAATAAASHHPVSTVIFYSPISFKHHITGSCHLSSAKNLLANAKLQATSKNGRAASL